MRALILFRESLELNDDMGKPFVLEASAITFLEQKQSQRAARPWGFGADEIKDATFVQLGGFDHADTLVRSDVTIPNIIEFLSSIERP